MSKAESQPEIGPLILVVDDAGEMRQIKRILLEMEGYRVIEAENGQVGLEAAIRERPQLILMNYMMPVMNGIEAAKLIRRESGLEGVPILMNSACEAERMEGEALLAGCNEYLEEPYSHRRLLEKVSNHILAH